jgi:hypothetical protein
MTSAPAATSEMDHLDELGAKAFDGYLVRKDPLRGEHRSPAAKPPSPRCSSTGATPTRVRPHGSAVDPAYLHRKEFADLAAQRRGLL